jgi:hypothetical protein
MILNFHYSTAIAVVLRITHGYEVKEVDDPFVNLANRVTDHGSQATAPGAFMVDILPFCELYYVDVYFGFR